MRVCECVGVYVYACLCVCVFVPVCVGARVHVREKVVSGMHMIDVQKCRNDKPTIDWASKMWIFALSRMDRTLNLKF